MNSSERTNSRHTEARMDTASGACSRQEQAEAERVPAERLPTERDLERLISSVRSAGSDRGFPRRVTNRYLQWILLFVGWALKAPPHSPSRERIGDFWAALSEHPGAGTAQVCEAMDALGFFFGHVRREVDALSFPAEPEGQDDNRRTDRPPENQKRIRLARPNPTLRAPVTERPDKRPTDEEDSKPELSDWELSQYLPEGILPDEPNAREEIPVRDVRSEEELSQRAPTTLFNPEGLAPPPGETEPRSEEPKDESENPASENDEVQPAGSRKLWGEFPSHESKANEKDSEDSSEKSLESDGSEPDRVPVELPKPVADRLRRAAKRLGLPASVFAARAIEIVCEDAGIERTQESTAESPLERYQTQLDLLRLQKEEENVPATDDAENADADAAPRAGSSDNPEAVASAGA